MRQILTNIDLLHQIILLLQIISRFQVALVKFDESYPYGEKHDVWKQLADATLSQENLLLGEVNIADYGDKDNSDLGELFGAKKRQFSSIQIVH